MTISSQTCSVLGRSVNLFRRPDEVLVLSTLGKRRSDVDGWRRDGGRFLCRLAQVQAKRWSIVEVEVK